MLRRKMKRLRQILRLREPLSQVMYDIGRQRGFPASPAPVTQMTVYGNTVFDDVQGAIYRALYEADDKAYAVSHR
jgi:hypothetical protein